MNRISAYTTNDPVNKGVVVDVNGMMVDIITVLKASGLPLDLTLERFTQLWNEVQVTVHIDPKLKN